MTDTGFLCRTIEAEEVDVDRYDSQNYCSAGTPLLQLLGRHGRESHKREQYSTNTFTQKLSLFRCF